SWWLFAKEANSFPFSPARKVASPHASFSKASGRAMQRARSSSRMSLIRVPPAREWWRTAIVCHEGVPIARLLCHCGKGGEAGACGMRGRGVQHDWRQGRGDGMQRHAPLAFVVLAFAGALMVFGALTFGETRAETCPDPNHPRCEIPERPGL